MLVNVILSQGTGIPAARSCQGGVMVRKDGFWGIQICVTALLLENHW